MKKIPFIFTIACLLLAVTGKVGYAQSAGQLSIGLNRDFGYGGFGNDIQGLFTIKVTNPPSNLSMVGFYVDSTLMGEVKQAPFSLQFNTDSYPLGTHSLSAIGYLSDGSQIRSNTIDVIFVSPSAGGQAALKIVIPVVGLVVLMIIVSLALPLILNKGKLSKLPLGATRKYGIGGGAICPKCGRPFPIRLWFINLGTGKFDRCPYCGKWSYVHRSSPAELRAAELAEVDKAKPETPISGESEAEKTKKELDDSRFQDM